MTPLRVQLLEILKTKGLRRLPEPIELASGELSSDFVDGKEALAHWSDLKVAGDAIVETLRANGIAFDAVGGLTLGADAARGGDRRVRRLTLVLRPQRAEEARHPATHRGRADHDG